MSPIYEYLAELSAARMVWHDAKEEGRPRRDIRVLKKQLHWAIRACLGESGELRRPSRLARNVDIRVDLLNSDPRLRRMRAKRELEHDLIAQGFEFGTPQFHALVEREMTIRESTWFLQEDLSAAVYNVLARTDKIPYNDDGFAMVAREIHSVMSEHGYTNVRVNTVPVPARGLNMTVSAAVPGILSARIEGSVRV